MTGQLDVADEFSQDAHSIGALHGSARGSRNIKRRLAAMERLSPLEGERLLDVGCGTGEYTTAMAPRFESVHGIEIERNRLDIFGQHKPNNVSLHVMSVNKLDFDDETFDRIVLIEVLEHLADIPAALNEIRRVLKPDGRVLITTPSRRWPVEQHGVLLRGKRRPSYLAPGLVWIKRLHERFSDAAAFEPRDISSLAGESQLALDSHTFMMPPLDGLGDNHPIHRVLDRAENSIKQLFGQTIVASLRHQRTEDFQ